MLTFEADAALLNRMIPPGLELDAFEGRALVSLVGFRFAHTALLGVRVPFHQQFDEINLRVYFRRDVGRELRRGVTFVREVVSRRLVAFVARLAYNEPYTVRPVHSVVPPASDSAPFAV